MLSDKKPWYALIFGYVFLVMVLAVGLAACSKQSGVDSKDLPELSKLIQAFVLTDDSIVRAGPGSQFKPMARIAGGAKVEVIARDGEWLLIVSKRGNAPGYIEAATARPDNGASSFTATVIEGPYQVVADTQVRRGPGVHYASLASIPKGIKITVVGAEEGWLKVQSKHGKPAGYVDANYAQPIVAN